LAEPFSVAPELVIALAARVVTGGADAVVNDSTVPKLVPIVFEAIPQ
jgi:hypothetical protein